MSSKQYFRKSLKLTSLLVLGTIPAFGIAILVLAAVGSLLELVLEPGDPCFDLIPFLIFFVPLVLYTRFAGAIARNHKNSIHLQGKVL